ncbi:site-specific integrase [Alicyclobacillus sp.]|uniref:tyrosine-type recombinase/integrase n=1 Tax=Alicyclobacillus sp. TaxID=61169 RepID=UPI0025BBE212|nr:site-specific integrase [Alicyclobacillus sp.]MCL6516588.1 tyrosine-type recombinase/integrase [Alicyclobacillus sp.]
MPGQIINRGKNTWLVRVYMGTDASGKRRYHNKTVHGTKKDAERYLTGILRDRDLGLAIEDSRLTLQQYMEKWLVEVAKQRVSERVFTDYCKTISRHVYPAIGDKRLSQLKPLDIQMLINDMSQRGIIRTTRYTHMILNQALKQAVKWGMIPRNPAEMVNLPKERRNEMRVMSKDEAKRFLDAAMHDQYYALFALLITSGLRPAEAYGLKWDDVDLRAGKIRIQRSLERRDRVWYLKEPKTPQSRRTVPLPHDVVDALKQYRLEQEQRKLKAGENYHEYGFVFTSENGEPIHHHNLVKRHFKPILRAAGLPEDIRLYDLRHTCATLLLLAGENPKIVSERLGHSSVTMTLDRYSHVLPDMQKSAADKLQNMLFGSE